MVTAKRAIASDNEEESWNSLQEERRGEEREEELCSEG